MSFRYNWHYTLIRRQNYLIRWKEILWSLQISKLLLNYYRSSVRASDRTWVWLSIYVKKVSQQLFLFYLYLKSQGQTKLFWSLEKTPKAEALLLEKKTNVLDKIKHSYLFSCLFSMLLWGLMVPLRSILVSLCLGTDFQIVLLGMHNSILLTTFPVFSLHTLVLITSVLVSVWVVIKKSIMHLYYIILPPVNECMLSGLCVHPYT